MHIGACLLSNQRLRRVQGILLRFFCFLFSPIEQLCFVDMPNTATYLYLVTCYRQLVSLQLVVLLCTVSWSHCLAMSRATRLACASSCWVLRRPLPGIASTFRWPTFSRSSGCGCFQFCPCALACRCSWRCCCASA